MAYALRRPRGKSPLTPLTGLVPPEVLLEGTRNTIAYERDEAMQKELVKAFSTAHGPEGAAAAIARLLCCLPGVRLSKQEPLRYQDVFRVVIMKFLDRHDLDLRSVRKSCVHIAHPDGKRVMPFDTYNLFYRDELEQTVLAPLRALKRFSDLESSPFLQAALAGFVESGAMDSYLGRLRVELARRHAAADAALRERFPPGTRWSRPEGGLSLWVVLPEGIDAERVAVRAAAEGVLVTPGRLFDPRPRTCTAMRLSLTRTDEATIARGLEVLGRAAHDEHAALFVDDPDSRPLIL